MFSDTVLAQLGLFAVTWTGNTYIYHKRQALIDTPRAAQSSSRASAAMSASAAAARRSQRAASTGSCGSPPRPCL
jgi:hypothetical protein